MLFQGFYLPQFPISVKITGIEVYISRNLQTKAKRGAENYVMDDIISLAIHHPKLEYTEIIGENRANVNEWKIGSDDVVYGGSNDMVCVLLFLFSYFFSSGD